MTGKEFSERLLKEFDDYRKFRFNVVKLVTDYVSSEHDKYDNTVMSESDLDSMLDDMAFFRAWIEDKLNDNCKAVGMKGYNRTRFKKIRKALGYNI